MYHFIVNKHGGGGRAFLTWQKVQKILEENNIEYKYSDTEDAAAGELARRFCSLNEESVNIVVVGGDGTIGQVLNGITDFSKVKLGIIPTGSGNDFARGTGITGNTRTCVYRVLRAENQKKIDLGCAEFENGTKKYFGISCGFGFDALVCRLTDESKLKKVLNRMHLGKLSYVLITLLALKKIKKHNVTVVIDKDDAHSIEYKDLVFLAFMNLCFEGGGVNMAPDAVCNDGIFNYCAGYDVPLFKVLFLFATLLLGIRKKFYGLEFKKGRTFCITSESPMAVHTDGEYLGDARQLKIDILPSALTLLM